MLRKDVLSPEEIQKLITCHYDNENPIVRRAFIFCLYCGLRFCDVKDLTYKNVDYDPADVLSYDPGWNQYENGSSNTPMSEDMAVIVAPTDAAFERYFKSGGGAAFD